MKVDGILETALYVENLEACAQFYREVLGLDFYASLLPRHVFFRCGEGMLLLFNPAEALKSTDVPVHGASGPQHVCFRVADADLDDWAAHLQKHGVPIEQEIHWPRGGRSLYFRDPAGNSVELASPIIWGF